MANIPIDDLQIDIVVNSDAASEAILKVADALKKTESSSKKLKAVTDAIKEVKDTSQEAASATSEFGDTVEEAGAKSKGLEALKKVGSYAKTAANSLKSVATGMASAFGNRISNTISNISEKVHTLFASLKRIAFYRLIRSAIKGITTAVKEGVNALIEWDRTYGNNTSYAAKTADEIAAKWGEVKKSFGAAAMPLIQMVQPALMAVMDTAIMVANTINQIFRSLQGYSTYMKATTQKIGESANKVKGAAKELKRVLFGFDELNVLPSDSNRGSGGADSSAGELDFVETDIDKAFTGRLSEIINNLVESVQPVTIARVIAEKLNKAIELVNNFLKETNFLRIGQKIGTFLTGMLENIDWNGLGQILVRWITTIPTIIIGAIQRINLGSVGKAIYNFLKGAIDTAIEWVKSIDWFSTIYNLFSQLGNLIANMKPIDLATRILKFVVSVVRAILEGLAGLFVGLMKSTFDLVGGVLGWLGSIASGLYEKVSNWFEENIVGGLKDAWEKFKQWLGLDEQTIEPKVKLGDEGWQIVEGEISKQKKRLAENPITLILQFATSNLPSAAAYIWEVLQKAFYKSPLSMPTIITNSAQQTFAGKALLNSVKFASGGVPDVGTLFYAGEAGSEVVANMSNGRTGVMNTDQMQQAIANGNIDVVNAIYALMNTMVSTVNGKSFDIYMDSAKVGKSVTAYQSNQARRGIAQGAY